MNEEQEFLKNYDVSKYERPSVTVDMLLFTVEEDTLKLMLIKRKKPPYKDCWAIPGGFVNMNESVEQAAKRELMEETGVSSHLEQFGIYSAPNRDPRTRVISIAYIALTPWYIFSQMQAGDDAKEVALFDVILFPDSFKIKELRNTHKGIIKKENLAFDHAQIIEDGIKYIQKRLNQESYQIVFNLVNDKFTLFDLQKVYEAILGKKLTKSNFRKNVLTSFNLKDTGEVSRKYQRPAKLYKIERN